jgi:hypothetical protein
MVTTLLGQLRYCECDGVVCCHVSNSDAGNYFTFFYKGLSSSSSSSNNFLLSLSLSLESVQSNFKLNSERKIK